MEAEGHHILKLNIGNPAPFGFEAPEEMLQDVILNLPTAHGYGDSKGLLSARRAVVQYYQSKNVHGMDIEDRLTRWRATRPMISSRCFRTRAATCRPRSRRRC